VKLGMSDQRLMNCCIYVLLNPSIAIVSTTLFTSEALDDSRNSAMCFLANLLSTIRLG
jgi:hypothetical protein